MRYVDFMESKGGREIASYALDRATQIFLKVFSFTITAFFFLPFQETCRISLKHS